MDSDLFPLKSVGDVRKLFERHLSRGRDEVSKTFSAVSKTCQDVNDEPNLALLSIVAGAVENNMTMAKSLASISESDTSHLAASDEVRTTNSKTHYFLNLPLRPITPYIHFAQVFGFHIIFLCTKVFALFYITYIGFKMMRKPENPKIYMKIHLVYNRPLQC